jgi:hypothetical protein
MPLRSSRSSILTVSERDDRFNRSPYTFLHLQRFATRSENLAVTCPVSRVNGFAQEEQKQRAGERFLPLLKFRRPSLRMRALNLRLDSSLAQDPSTGGYYRSMNTDTDKPHRCQCSPDKPHTSEHVARHSLRVFGL